MKNSVLNPYRFACLCFLFLPLDLSSDAIDPFESHIDWPSWLELRLPLLYYNPAMHLAAFALPNQMMAALEPTASGAQSLSQKSSKRKQQMRTMQKRSSSHSKISDRVSPSASAAACFRYPLPDAGPWRSLARVSVRTWARHEKSVRRAVAAEAEKSGRLLHAPAGSLKTASGHSTSVKTSPGIKSVGNGVADESSSPPSVSATAAAENANAPSPTSTTAVSPPLSVDPPSNSSSSFSSHSSPPRPTAPPAVLNSMSPILVDYLTARLHRSPRRMQRQLQPFRSRCREQILQACLRSRWRPIQQPPITCRIVQIISCILKEIYLFSARISTILLSHLQKTRRFSILSAYFVRLLFSQSDIGCRRCAALAQSVSCRAPNHSRNLPPTTLINLIILIATRHQHLPRPRPRPPQPPHRLPPRPPRLPPSPAWASTRTRRSPSPLRRVRATSSPSPFRRN